MGEVDQSFKRLFLMRVDALLEWLLGDIQDVAPCQPIWRRNASCYRIPCIALRLKVSRVSLM